MAFQYARVLAAAGFESALAVNRRSPYAAGREVEVYDIPGASLASPFNHLAVARAVRHFRPDVILGHGSRGADFCKSPLVRLMVPKSARCVGVLHGENAKHFRGLDHVITVSEKLHEALVASGVFDRRSVSVCPNAVQVPAIETLLPPPGGTVPVIGFLGRFDPCKGLDVLLRACAQLKSRGVAFHLDIGGSGPQEGEMRQLAAELGLGGCVRWLGWVSDKRMFFGDIDLFAMPSREEAVGLVMLEAMAHQRAVILSDCPGPMEIAKTAGVVFPREDVRALAECLAKTLSDAAFRQDLARRGRELVSKSYSEASLSQKLMEILECF